MKKEILEMLEIEVNACKNTQKTRLKNLNKEELNRQSTF